MPLLFILVKIEILCYNKANKLKGKSYGTKDKLRLMAGKGNR